MPKIGRNDPCPCGSGKKYKRCCLAQDEKNRIVRIGPAGDQPPFLWEEPEDPKEIVWNADTVSSLIERDLFWDVPGYKILAKYLLNQMAGRYEWEIVAQAVTLWCIYANIERPATRKAGVLPAAIEYCTAIINGLDVTQSEIAEMYGVSPGSISRHTQRIMNFAESEIKDVMNWGDDGDSENETDDELEHQPTLHPAANRISNEKFLHEIGQLLSEQPFDSFESIEEANDWINRKINEPAQFQMKNRPLTAREQAQHILYDAWGEPSPAKRVKLARQALKIYPHAADAYNILAQDNAPNEHRAAEYYKQGMLAGEKDLKDLDKNYFKNNKGHFWGLIETRPYMRAKFGYAGCCLVLGRIQEAAAHFEQLLELNPNDNQGVRYSLAEAYIRLKQYDRAEQFIRKYNENTANFNYNLILAEYGKNGITRKLSRLYQIARKQNPYVADYLTARKRLPKQLPEYIGYGDRNEAVVYAASHLNLWRRHRELLEWLASQ